MAASEKDIFAACRLRFNVFNLELGEGLAASYKTGLDQDPFDRFCEHLIIEDQVSGRVVGTYRMQTGASAMRHLGYYCAQEFDFAPYERLRNQVLELGRASIDRDHRSSEVLTLLWRGIGQYAAARGLRYLVGCSSLNSQNPQDGWSVYHQLRKFVVEDATLATTPRAAYRLPEAVTSDHETRVPKLLKTYIAVGARICGAPAWDRDFGTIDFLTLLDLQQITPAARSRFLPESH